MAKFHEDHTEPTNPEAVFVFGSNLAARHGGGAAALAEQKYGASRKVAEGLSGLSYAIPTKDENIKTLPLPVVRKGVATFLKFAADNPHTEFFVTRVGCVLAGYKDREIAPLFALGQSKNLNLPIEWKRYFE